MYDELVSVIIPAYNCEKFIQQCVESILQQTYKNIEVIIVDDGSKDNTKKILQSYNDKIKYIYQNNAGAPEARNNGLQHAKGKYILFFDSDDRMLPNMIKELVFEQQKTNSDLVIANYICISENGEFFSEMKEYEENKTYNIEQFIHLLHQISPLPDNKLFLKTIIEKYSIKFADVKVGQDLNFFLKYIAHTTKVAVRNNNVCEYRIVNNSISRKYDKRIYDIVESLNDVERQMSFYDNIELELFEMELNKVRIVHYYNQLSKCRYIQDRQLRKELISDFWDERKKINNKCLKKMWIIRIKYLMKYLWMKLFMH